MAHGSWLLRVSKLLIKMSINAKRVGKSERSGMVHWWIGTHGPFMFWSALEGILIISCSEL